MSKILFLTKSIIRNKLQHIYLVTFQNTIFSYKLLCWENWGQLLESGEFRYSLSWLLQDVLCFLLQDICLCYWLNMLLLHHYPIGDKSWSCRDIMLYIFSLVKYAESIVQTLVFLGAAVSMKAAFFVIYKMPLAFGIVGLFICWHEKWMFACDSLYCIIMQVIAGTTLKKL